jgi:predicted nuclease of predicted toxin-antitoxin system
MRFLVDAQLPRRIAHRLREQGHDAIHTLDLPEANRTADNTIADVADREDRVVVTKDADFQLSFTLMHKPRKLLLVTTGNITNQELESVLLPNLPAILGAFEISDFVELGRSSLIVHDRS